MTVSFLSEDDRKDLAEVYEILSYAWQDAMEIIGRK